MSRTSKHTINVVDVVIKNKSMGGETKLKHNRWEKDNIIHQESALGLVNIYLGLHDTEGNHVESVEIRPDEGVKIDLNGERLDYLRVRLIKS